MPPGGRRIPRAPSPRRSRRVAESDEEIPTIVAKAGGDLLALAAQIRDCHECGRCTDGRIVHGTGHPRAPVMLVTDRPSAADLESGGAFTEESPALEKAFAALGMPLSWLYGTTVVRCGTDRATAEQLAACARHLMVEIEAIEPAVIVAFGSAAAEGIRALDGKCGLRVPDELPQGGAVRLRPGLSLVVTEQLPHALTNNDAKRRLWKDLQGVPQLVGTT